MKSTGGNSLVGGLIVGGVGSIVGGVGSIVGGVGSIVGGVGSTAEGSIGRFLRLIFFLRFRCQLFSCCSVIFSESSFGSGSCCCCSVSSSFRTPHKSV